MNKRVIFIPGNSNSSTKDNWFPYLEQELIKHKIEVVSSEFPDTDLARAEYWLPFLINQLKVDENSILVGHSSGAIAAMRLAEKYSLTALVLVGTYHTNLNMEKERQSGYFETPWQWDKIKANTKWISLFASQDDPWIPIKEPRFIHSKLNCEYHEFKIEGHFGGDYYKPTFPELLQSIIKNISRNQQ